LANDAAKAFNGSSYGNSTYIDSTPYSLGATKPDVILSERSTGCQAVIAPEQTAPASICPPSPVAGGEGNGLGNYDPSSLTVYNLQAGGSTASARDFYNLTVRPPAKLSNGNVSLLFPLSIPAAISSAFGWRLHPIGGEMRFHSGTDLSAPQGTPVLAAFSGKVDIADFVGGYGLTVVLQHNKGDEQTLYAHLSEVFVKPGEEVKQGEVIGRVGSTGLSTGPHLHFEFRKLTPEGWVVMDPGSVLEQSLAQLVRSLQVAQVNPKLQLPVVFRVPGKALLQGIESQNTAKTNTANADRLLQPQANAQRQQPQISLPQDSE
jgi:murein DD-endopeptidase MepM/ murein hydrolase activator NlpD